MAAALLFLPIYAGEGWKPGTPDYPTWHIILVLFATVGLPYFVLATTSPLLQKWLAAAKPGARVYRLYALSNVGSLLALVTYPSVIEPTLTGRWQAYAWSAGFALFVGLCGYSAFLAWKARQAEETPAAPRYGKMGTVPTEPNEGDSPRFFTRVMWLLLAAFGSTMLLAVTNQMCLDVAVVPFLWVLPLGLYLLSFIICFDNERWYYRPVFGPLMIVTCGLMTWMLYVGTYATMLRQIGVFSLGLFACCMACHGELVRLKPSPRYLTSFYLMVSAGGALGGVFVALLAPHIFRTYAELYIGIAGCFATTATAFLYDRWRRRPEEKRQLLVSGSVALAALVVLSVCLIRVAAHAEMWSVSVERDFYGVLRVAELYPKSPERHQFRLIHGRITHGVQFAARSLERVPTCYYGTQSGVGLALRFYPRSSPIHVGIVGLGIGTLAAYGQPGDRYTFYEIAPNVVKLATTRFTYLKNCAATYKVVEGDGRLSLERELREGPSDPFDIIVLDAFSSDAIPVHLLTREAFRVYLGLLKPGGVIALNATNRHFDLRPVLHGIAEEFNLKMVPIHAEGDPKEITASSSWILVTANESFISQPVISASFYTGAPENRTILWTDDFSNLFRVVKW